MNKHNDAEMFWSLSFGHNLQQVLKHNDISQGYLAKELGTTEAMISRYIHGISVPSVYKVCQMASVIGCDVSDLIKSKFDG